MYCPRCGSAAPIRDGYLVCRASGMDFSAEMTALLIAIADKAPALPSASSVNWGGSWHCPLDGVGMVWAEGLPLCPSCSRTLPPDVLYSLIEFHWHPAVQ